MASSELSPGRGLYFVMGEFACRYPGCDKVLPTSKGRAGHERLVHGKVLSDPLGSESQATNPGGEAMQEKDIKAMIKDALAEEKQAEAAAKKEESEKSGIAEAFKRISDRLDKQGVQLDDFCSRFPELCARVDSIEKSVSHKLEQGSEAWKAARTADLEHILFQECPECTPVRDEVLAAGGKRLADVEAKGDSQPETQPEASS